MCIFLSRSMRPEYGDCAFGYVQIKRDGTNVILKAAVCPETWTKKKSYNVYLSMNDTSILSVDCKDCKGSRGGCKHSVAFVAWLHRHSEEPSPTEEKCYWRKSKLSHVGTSLKAISAKEMTGALEEETDDEDRRFTPFLNDVLEGLKSIPFVESNLLNQYSSELSPLSIHSLMYYSTKNGMTNFTMFLKYASLELSKYDLLKVAKDTLLQYESVLWKELRFGRITASKLHEISHCHTPSGSTVKILLGVTKIKDNKYLQRGRDLESEIITVVEKIIGQKVKKTGLYLNAKYPLFGATPDGITKDFLIEVIAPFYKKTFQNYISESGEPTLRYKLRILLQLFLCNKKYGYFCVASADFERSKKVTVVKMDRNDALLMPYIEKSQENWQKHIDKSRRNYCYIIPFAKQ
ncbi:hypothetical protein B566_EDAN018029 [Ephemera danica]|nr:hypothetical protein B566_EDAN018029 [Ephemera danica]